MVASEDTRRRVLEAAGALGYKKHNKGKVSAVLRFGVAEMLTPAEQLEDPFYLYLKNFVAQECMEQKIDLIPLLRDGESFTCSLSAAAQRHYRHRNFYQSADRSAAPAE